MTKERKLAIDMWLWIRESYAEWDDYFWGTSDEDGCVAEMKYRFKYVACKGKFPVWRGGCWLCNYIHSPKVTSLKELFSCGRCPLKSCHKPDSAYQVLDRHLYKGDIHVSEEVYRNCCTTILNALGYKGE